METLTFTPDALRTAAEQYRRSHPQARARSVAKGIGVSEAELLAAGCPDSVLRLRPAFPELLMELEGLGPLMALTRNEACVHEKTGVYRKGEMMEHHRMGLFSDEKIDLRFFFDAWHLGFFSDEGHRLSFQFFDRDGTAVHKVFSRKETDMDAMRALAIRYAHEDQSPAQPVEPVVPPDERPEPEINTRLFVKGWRALKDTHDFFGLLRKHGVSRRQAVHLAPDDLARRVPETSARRVLQEAAARALPIMIFVGSRGCVQIHTGPVERLVETGPWFNVLDPDFNLHLNESLIAESWVVHKPTVDGVVTALEVFDAQGELIAQFFGKRKPGVPEMQAWRDLVAGL